MTQATISTPLEMTIWEVFLSEVAKEEWLIKNGLIYIYKWYNLYNVYFLKNFLSLKRIYKKQKKSSRKFSGAFLYYKMCINY